MYDLAWGAGAKVRHERHREEVEQSKYVVGEIDMSREAFGAFHREMFDRYYQLSEVLLKSGLVWPALEHCLKCSHLFNILDSSNSIGVTERTAYILRVRQLALQIAKAYVGETAGKATA
jgi:glycyl-tRNA synthetase alpha chain